MEATIKVICHKLADEGRQPTRGASEDEDEDDIRTKIRTRTRIRIRTILGRR